jgi:glycerol-3-phosphate O-acyltransferase/dihydroxyacetone phosphate acyltransferase
MIDIATLAATIPYRRHVSFWAKSSMFANPVSRWILVSANSIPVQRNPDRVASSPTSSSSSQALFRESCLALESGSAIGVFPEGTSYTQPGIMQIKEGAGWTAVEYVKWCSSKASTTSGERSSSLSQQTGGLLIVPVATVYTDKSRYQSRISVRYGEPISIASYFSPEAGSEPSMEESKATVKRLMADIEKILRAMTIDAPDWETHYAARTARDILWEEEDSVPLGSFVLISQSLVHIFSPLSIISNPRIQPVRDSLIKYFSLLHHTSLTHSSLSSAVPTSLSASTTSNLSSPTLHKIFIRTLCQTVLHPYTLLSLPALITHIPAYILASLSVKVLATPDEEEGPAQFKSIFGGLGAGIGCGTLGWSIQRWLSQGAIGHLLGNLLKSHRFIAGDGILRCLDSLRTVLEGDDGWLKKWTVKLGLIYSVGWAMVRWHNLVIKGNYRRFNYLLTSFKVILGSIVSSTSRSQRAITADILANYSRPPPPPRNIFIAKPSSEPTDKIEQAAGRLGKIGRLGLVPHLLHARQDAMQNLHELLRERALEMGRRPEDFLLDAKLLQSLP